MMRAWLVATTVLSVGAASAAPHRSPPRSPLLSTPLAFPLSTPLAMPALASPGPTVAPPRPMKLDLARKQPRTAALAPPSSRLIFMHRCPVGGCFVQQGPDDDSRTNTSSIAQGAVSIGAFTQSDAVWTSIMQCMRDTYAPFDIQVTDVDPGSATPHYEHIVGGKPSQLRNDIQNAGGVAPFTCGEIPNAISYTFDVYGPDGDTICWTAAQETAHAFGLEHELNGSDPMTYLAGPLPKRFQFAESKCGEDLPRACECNSVGVQSSYKHILALFGPGAPTPPTVRIASPASGRQVQPGFVTKIDATDDVHIERVELWIDGAKVGEATEPPYWITAPALAEGPHAIEARAIDFPGATAAATVDVELGPPCTASRGCEDHDDDVCVSGNCVPGPDAPGGLGSFCASSAECESRRCIADTSGARQCVEACDFGDDASCPGGFSCLADGAGGGICWQDEASGCCSANRSPIAPALVAAGLLALVLRRRRATPAS